MNEFKKLSVPSQHIHKINRDEDGEIELIVVDIPNKYITKDQVLKLIGDDVVCGSGHYDKDCDCHGINLAKQEIRDKLTN